MRGFFAGLIALVLSAGGASAQVGTIALTFDYWVNSENDVWFALYSRGFRGTYYVAPETIDKAGGPTSSHLILLKMIGMEIGVYTNVNMVTLYQNNRNNGFAKLQSLYSDMGAKGFVVPTLAPNQREWDAALANMARDRYTGVRVANSGPAIQSYPIPDLLNVNGGAAVASLGSGTSLQSVKDATDAAIAANGMIVIVIHKIGPVADGLTFATADWNSLLTYWSSKGSSLRVMSFRDALKPP